MSIIIIYREATNILLVLTHLFILGYTYDLIIHMHSIIQFHNSVMLDRQYSTKKIPHSDQMVEISENIPLNIINPTEHCYGFE